LFDLTPPRTVCLVTVSAMSLRASRRSR
jgi:hypothetical protein